LEAEVKTLKQMFALQKEQYNKMVDVCGTLQQDRDSLFQYSAKLDQDIQHEKVQHNELVEEYRRLLDDQVKVSQGIEDIFEDRWGQMELRMADLNDYNLNVSSILLSFNDRLTHHQLAVQ
jgi:hypothetical protein